ncbi:transposase [Suttonella ornithocola]|uniref:Transposase IS116/IS110/IS902 family n=1 Tax=Suttonella ornithocola TaxID=279832 RepID=A0A380MNN9_9GAMM|nr:transposase [Suttonella ornithocola]SUO93646.1 Transposase IS116/IS110/IS902 family [Suttonella ornithocola]
MQKEIQTLILEHPELSQRRQLLQTIPGIGERTIPYLLGLLGDTSKFSDVKKLISFVGLAPRHHQSGSSVRGKSQIGRAGDSTIRSALFMPAIAVGFGKYAKFSPFATRLEANGKKRKAIVIALMRKLLSIAYAVIRNNEPFNPALHQMS